MPVNYQIMPEHSYPHQMIHINDNSVIPATFNTDAKSVNSLLCVFASPKGRPGVRTIAGLAEFIEEYGQGAFKYYGQPYLNAYAAASTGKAVVHCLRVTAEDATFSSISVVAKYKVDTGAKTMSVKFVTQKSDADITTLDNLDTAATVNSVVDVDGYTPVKLFTVAYQGKGEYGKNIRFRIKHDSSSDKTNDFKNYLFEVLENTGTGLRNRETFNVTFVEESLYGIKNLFCEDVINNIEGGSNQIKVHVNYDGFKKIFDEYKKIKDDTELTADTFDVLLGLNKETKKAIDGYTLEPQGGDVIAVNTSTGIGLEGGGDGAIGIDKDTTTRNTALDNLYIEAFGGKIDPLIVSSNRFPTTMILDANYSADVKKAIVALNTKRKDCVAILDCTTKTKLHTDIKTFLSGNGLDAIVNDRDVAIEAYSGKTIDPVTKKSVDVTGTYALAIGYFEHFDEYGGKHKPYAGNRYGVLGGFIPNTIYPVFDEDIHSELMDELADLHINFAKFNPRQVVVRATQDTRQKKLSALSELSCVFILKDIQRDAKRLASTLEYEFSEATDISRFNILLETITSKYADAQVRSITASFAKNTWEAQHKTIHLYIAMVNKDIIRNTIIEIDVNRDDL